MGHPGPEFQRLCSSSSQRFIGWDERVKITPGRWETHPNSLAKTAPQLVVWTRLCLRGWDGIRAPCHFAFCPAVFSFLGRILLSAMASSPYFSLAVLFAAALGFGLAPLGLAWLWARVFSPPKPNAIKNAIYECGLESKGDAWVQFRSAYYLYAIIFLIFDVEAVFLLPFAVAFTGLGAAACAAMLVFVLLLVEGLAWAWAKGILTWA